MRTTKDLVERHLEEWTEARPDLDSSPKRFRRETRKSLRPFRLELWEYDVLAALRRQGEPFELPPTKLAKLGMLTTGAMTNRIDRLEERDLVERRPDPEDRRSLYVKMTAKGLNLIDQALAARMESAAKSVSILSGSETATLEALLKKLVLSSERSV